MSSEPPFSPPVALASLSGVSDASWARQAEAFAGAAFLGGIALDEATREAARELVARDRVEFLPPDPVSFVDEQLATMESVSMQAGLNVRTTTLEPLQRVAGVCQERDAILEINAHCRQGEMCAAGAGESLLRDTGRLCEQVRVARDEGAPVSVKVRAEVDGVDLPVLAERVVNSGATVIHVDAMDSEHVVGEVADAVGATIIANNEVRDHDSVWEYLDYGADAVSVGRPSDDPAVLERVRDAAEGWYAGQRPLDGADRHRVEPGDST